jgi:hypothetical protein
MFMVGSTTAQNNQFDLKNALNDITNDSFKSVLLNNELVKEFLDEYIEEAESRGIVVLPYINSLNFIVVEPDSQMPSQLNGLNLGRVDKDKKLILLSGSCLIDRTILKATLFREVSHYAGVPYDAEGVAIMSVNKPEGYSYSWISCEEVNDIKEFEYNWLFTELKKVIH